ncbi:MAG TPA: hypothetical protein VK727_12870, partial [Steroidobacteraceae bacterium]|nr:hypothetical protein [Steroidobacteraceae bacterium]
HLGPICYPGQEYKGIIDIGADHSTTPTGLAVQTQGHILAVAHARQGTVELFDKVTGAHLRAFTIPVSADASNQLSATPNGDLWVIAGASVLRYTALDSNPTLAATISGLSHPLAVAVHPSNDDLVLVADGGSSEQVKAYDRNGLLLWTYGQAGGYGNDPTVDARKLWFRFDATLERTALAVQANGSFWVVDTCNDRMLHISNDRKYLEQIAYLPASYSATVDPAQPSRVFANYLEFEAGPGPLAPGPSGGWKLLRNWLAGLPREADFPKARNGEFGGLQTVVTLSNQRTYALSTLPDHNLALLELPAQGAARYVRGLAAYNSGATATVLYENGDLGFARVGANSQSVYRQTLMSFDSANNPVWQLLPHEVGSAPLTPDAPSAAGRIPLTSSNALIVLDPSVSGTKGDRSTHFHLGAIEFGSRSWLWKASPVGTIDEPGAFQTRAIDGTVNYGGDNVWAAGHHIVYGYHGEGFTDPSNGRAGEANQFIHFHDDGLFIGQFGVPSTRVTAPAPAAGVGGNSFSNILIEDHSRLFWYHNDESQHGGVHRWTIDNLASVAEMVGTGRPGGTIELR